LTGSVNIPTPKERCNGVVHSVEVILDDDTDRQIRAEWAVLAEAGLPSQARHTGASNRPHVTLALTETLTEQVADRLAVAVADLPIPVTLGGLLLFGTSRVVLARLVVPSAALLDLQSRVRAALDYPVDPHGTFGPGRWTPHVTLARRLRSDQLGIALTQLGVLAPISGELVRARRWDIAAKREQWLN
jgi:2'-5' RNA ligase